MIGFGDTMSFRSHDDHSLSNGLRTQSTRFERQ
jgi:hypothetical protein